MKEHCQKILDELIGRYPALKNIEKNIVDAYECIATAYKNGGKLLAAGNGGSAADAEHIVGELMRSFVRPRSIGFDMTQKLRAIDLEMGSALGKNCKGHYRQLHW